MNHQYEEHEDTITLEQLLREHELTQGTPCSRCGYDLYQHRLGSPSCLRCYPTRDYHTYAEQLDRLHPWKRQPIKEW